MCAVLLADGLFDTSFMQAYAVTLNSIVIPAVDQSSNLVIMQHTTSRTNHFMPNPGTTTAC